MKRLIVNFSPSGTGALKHAKIGTQHLYITQENNFCPLPSNSNGPDFYVDQKKLLQSLNFDGNLTLFKDKDLRPFEHIEEKLEELDRVELWIEPTSFSYIGAFHFLHSIQSYPDIKFRLWINWTPRPLGMMNEDQLLAIKDMARPAPLDIFDEASRLWTAYQSDTPEKWFEHRNYTSHYFKQYKWFNKWMLRQLPHSDSGLRGISKQILNQVKDGNQVGYIVGSLLWESHFRFYPCGDYEFFTHLMRLADAYTPAITNVKLPGYDYWDSSVQRGNEWKQFCKSKPQLTSFGKALLNGRASWRDYNKTDLWWGGTHITDKNYWSYNPDKNILIPPN